MMKQVRRRIILGALAAPAVLRFAQAAPNSGMDAAAPTTARPAPRAAMMEDPSLPRWQEYAVPHAPLGHRPSLAVVIDDCGVMHNHTQRIVDLPGPLTLSWFPFSPNLPQQVAAACLRGHEATMHMPMESLGHHPDWVGPDPLMVNLSPEENLRRLQVALDAVPQTVGLNNHMGSIATRDTALMNIVAAEAMRRNMLFLDSVTIPHTVAYARAAAAGVPAAERDFFIDDVSDAKSILRSLEEALAHALRHGNAITIGHPRPKTIAALEAWLPTVARRGVDLTPLSAIVAYRNRIAMPQQRLAPLTASL